MERYKITNTTAKAPKYNKDKKDIRTASEKQGHFIQFQESTDYNSRTVLLPPGKFSVTSYVNDWFTDLEKKGEISIEVIKDMGSVLEQFRHQQSDKSLEKKVSDNGMKVVEMGSDKPIVEETPVENPGFVVTAKKG